jgi:hypothetical protein
MTDTMTATTFEIDFPNKEQPDYSGNIQAVSVQGDRVVGAGDLHGWQVAAAKKILGFEHLPQNWDSYGSPPPSMAVIFTALFFIRKVRTVDPLRPRIVAVPGGGIQFDYRLKFYLMHPSKFFESRTKRPLVTAKKLRIPLTLSLDPYSHG